MKDYRKDDRSAFPISDETTNEGLTLRDYFAAKTLPVIYAEIMGKLNEEFIAEITLNGKVQVEVVDVIAFEAYRFADAMMEARK